MAGKTPIETGLKYYRITGSEDKQIYRPWNALRLVEDHARLFVANREATVTELLPQMDGNKVSILCPYDAELFGHWWFEGPLFIEKMFERAASSNVVEMASLEDTMHSSPDADVHDPIFSSWGEGGFGEVWMNDEVSWAYPLFFKMRGMMDDLKKRQQNAPKALAGFLKRCLEQSARELVLFQASDWAFMIHNNSAADYAKFRQNTHYKNVCSLYAAATSALMTGRKRSGEAVLEKLENQDNLFPWIGELL
jgi:1,4-alpha-glucan branching enzyme